MSNLNRSLCAATRVKNRVAAIMSHTTRYSFEGTSRLAADTGLEESSISRLMHGKTNPLYSTAEVVVKGLSAALGRPLAFSEVFTKAERFPTPSVCELCGCKGCLPESRYESDGSLKPGFDDVVPGHWTGEAYEFWSGELVPDDPGTE